MGKKLLEFYNDESGQGMTEYILLTVVVALTLAVAFNAFRSAVLRYYNRLTFWVSLPFP